MSNESVECGVCSRLIYMREKSSKTIACKKCEKVFHVGCSGEDAKVISSIRAKNIPWYCSKCKQLNVVKRLSMSRPKSTSDTSSVNLEEKEILEELSDISKRVDRVKQAAIEKASNGTGDVDKDTTWAEIRKKIQDLEKEVNIIKNLLKEQSDQITTLSDDLLVQSKNLSWK
ncbi:hypothetical protein DMENIID0001_112830 [Sergentomyia squamirostris]